MDTVDLPAPLRELLRPGRAEGPADRGADPAPAVWRADGGHAQRSGLGGGIVIDKRAGWSARGGAPLVRVELDRAARGAGRAPAGLPGRGGGELVPGTGDGAGQRGSDERWAQ